MKSVKKLNVTFMLRNCYVYSTVLCLLRQSVSWIKVENRLHVIKLKIALFLYCLLVSRVLSENINSKSIKLKQHLSFWSIIISKQDVTQILVNRWFYYIFVSRDPFLNFDIKSIHNRLYNIFNLRCIPVIFRCLNATLQYCVSFC